MRPVNIAPDYLSRIAGQDDIGIRESAENQRLGGHYGLSAHLAAFKQCRAGANPDMWTHLHIFSMVYSFP